MIAVAKRGSKTKIGKMKAYKERRREQTKRERGERWDWKGGTLRYIPSYKYSKAIPLFSSSPQIFRPPFAATGMLQRVYSPI